LLMTDLIHEKPKKDLCVCGGWISISRIIGRHDPAGKSGRVCDLLDAFSSYRDIVRVQERKTHEGEFYCPSVQIF
jgi:hypothetical protein